MEKADIATIIAESGADARLILDDFKHRMQSGIDLRRPINESVEAKAAQKPEDVAKLINRTFGQLYGEGFSPRLVQESFKEYLAEAGFWQGLKNIGGAIGDVFTGKVNPQNRNPQVEQQNKMRQAMQALNDFYKNITQIIGTKQSASLQKSFNSLQDNIKNNINPQSLPMSSIVNGTPSNDSGPTMTTPTEPARADVDPRTGKPLSVIPGGYTRGMSPRKYAVANDSPEAFRDQSPEMRADAAGRQTSREQKAAAAKAAADAEKKTWDANYNKGYINI